MEDLKTALSLFSREQKVRLVPFIASVIVFLILPYPTESFIGAVCKILPVLSLVAYIITTRSQFPSKTKAINLETLLPGDAYSFFVLCGLILSVIGDLLIIIPGLIVPVGFLYMLIHLLYFIGIEISGRHQGGSRKNTSWFFFLLFVDVYLCTQSLTDSYVYKVFVLIYYVPLFITAWKATAAFQENPDDTAVMLSFIGACLFIVSDCTVVISEMGAPIPCSEHLVMLTYYGAQFGWAVSTSEFN